MIKVLKFGGSSVQDAEKIKHVCSIVIEESKKSRVAVVFSAMKGITDLLLNSAKIAAEGKTNYIENIGTLLLRQEKAVNELMSGNFAQEAMASIKEMIEELESLLKGVELVRECSPRSLDLIASFGERLNNFLIASYLNSIGQKAHYVDSREIIKTNKQYTRAIVYYEETYKNIKQRIFKEEGIPVITGFIASAEDGSTTTLGRNGSDFSASIIAAGVGANIIEIWTDVDGVLSADPKIVKSAFVVPEISVEEAMELSYFGAKVIHPSTVIPAFEKGIPMCIKNTLNPSAPGTMIVKKPKAHNMPIIGIASINDVSIINVVGGGMIGQPGFASKVFETFTKNNINMIMISQASSEHTICIVCLADDAKKAIALMKEDLSFELKSKAIEKFELKENLVIVSIIGENMRGTPGVAGKLFSTLGDNNINVYAIAQGSSERNISFVIKKEETEKSINVIHKSFLGV
ncbi:MAG: aspartate kinase [Spirochaetes bacterium]|nr:aspartate kinase [Spirochaetota bacterium]